MQLKITYTVEEMITFLTKRGYLIYDITVEVETQTYHNKTESTQKVFIAIEKDGVRYPAVDSFFAYSYRKEQYLEEVFTKVFNVELMELLDGNYFQNH